MAEDTEKIAELESEIEELKKSRDEFKNKYFYFKNVFQKQMQVFYQFYKLSDQSLQSLNGIFKGTSFENFLACGVQPANIDALWEFAKVEALNGNYEDVALLNDIIKYFVKLYNDTGDTPALGIQEVKESDIFDIDLHIRTSDSKAAGYIDKIILLGLTNAYTGEIIKKAVVQVTK